MRSLCTHAAQLPRTVAVRAEETFTVLQTARQRQQTPEFRAVYAKRAGIEGTLSQAVRAFGLRRSRYVGEAKTRLQHFVMAVSLNIVRLFAWSEERPREPTRRSCTARVGSFTECCCWGVNSPTGSGQWGILYKPSPPPV